MDWTEAIARVVTLDTFGNVWFWAAVVVAWAVACHWLIGVPFDMLIRARRGGAQEMQDLETLVDINVRRIIWFQKIAGEGAAAFAAFFLAGLGLLAIGYRVEWAIGALVLGVPLTGVAVFNLLLAKSLYEAPLYGAELLARMLKVRVRTQILAAISLFFTAVFGMAFNIEAMYFL